MMSSLASLLRWIPFVIKWSPCPQQNVHSPFRISKLKMVSILEVPFVVKCWWNLFIFFTKQRLITMTMTKRIQLYHDNTIKDKNHIDYPIIIISRGYKRPQIGVQKFLNFFGQIKLFIIFLSILSTKHCHLFVFYILVTISLYYVCHCHCLVYVW